MKIKTLTPFLLLLLAAGSAFGQTTWDGGGAATTSWGTAANWDNDTLPAFNGTDSLTVTSPSTGNTALTLGANRNIGRITFGAGATAMSLSGNTLQLSSTSTSAGTGTALWNANNTSDNVTATVNSNILLQSGSVGTYTGYFRENNNSSGGTRFNGTITQGAGENWTMRFSKASSKGRFFLNNASNSIYAIRNDGADVFSEIAGSFGGASITLVGGITGTRLTDHYTTAVNNNFTVSANSTWGSQIQTRLTGTMTQGSNTLSYGTASNGSNGNGVLTRLEYSSITGTGQTTLIGGGLSVSSMSQLSTGTLNLGSSSSASGVLVLSGSSGNGVPTWTDFATAKTYNQSGGANTWRIDAGTAATSTGSFGGFAAKDADLVIPATGVGLTSATFARNFQLGSQATLNGSQYATKSVTIQTDIAYGSVAGANRFFAVAANAGTSRSTTNLTLAGPVHELSGQITGSDVIMYPIGLANSQMAMVRISNASNTLTGTSRWIIGGNRSTFTTMGGGSIAAGSNMSDLSSIVAIFTSDGAFGGATEVNVSSQDSSGSNPAGTLLFEDANISGNTTFTRNINLQNVKEASAVPAWGSYAGDVIYTGTATLGGTVALVNNDDIIHVQAGTMALGVAGGAGATITNNRTNGTTHNKSGAGALYINNLTVNGSQATNNWNVREGSLIVNDTLAGAVSVSSGATLGGTGTIAGAVNVSGVLSPGALVETLGSGALSMTTGSTFAGVGTVGATSVSGTLSPGNSTGLISVSSTLNLTSLATSLIEINGVNRGLGINGYDAVDVSGALTYDGLLTADIGTSFGVGSYNFNIFDFASSSGTFTAVDLTNNYSGVLDSGNSWSLSSGMNTWGFDHSTGVLSLTVIPETHSALLGGIGVLLLLLRRRG